MKLIKIEEEMNEMFFERTSEIHTLMLSLLTGKHIVMLGEPGVGKSAVAEELCGRITGANFFHQLMRRDSTTDEIFGVPSIKALENDEFKRNGKNRLQQAHIAFIDEVFKSNSTVLNGLLTIMNEGTFEENGQMVKCPLMCLIAASNELPMEDDLAAVWDRFFFRMLVRDIEDPTNFLKFLKTKANPPVYARTTVSLDELELYRKAVKKVKVPDPILGKILELNAALISKQIRLTARRYGFMIQALQAEALLGGRREVVPDDFCALQNCIWIDPAHIPSAKEEIEKCYSELCNQVIGYYDEITEKIRLDRKGDSATPIHELVDYFRNLAPVLKEIAMELKTHPSRIKLNGYLAKIGKMRDEVNSRWMASLPIGDSNEGDFMSILSEE